MPRSAGFSLSIMWWRKRLAKGSEALSKRRFFLRVRFGNELLSKQLENPSCWLTSPVKARWCVDVGSGVQGGGRGERIGKSLLDCSLF